MNHTLKAGNAAGAMPFEKYRPFTPIELADRQWPNAMLTKAPRWCSVDLRDGNQALLDPMDVDEKLELFELLVKIGFVEIEVGFPSASQPDFDFLRKIIEEDRVPDSVTLQVLCQAREELIDRTAEALQGAKRAIFHLYNSTSTLQRRVVFGLQRDDIERLAVEGTRMVRERLDGTSDMDVTLEYSPESFTATELDFAVKVCDSVAEAWGASEARPMIVNLPSTVEMATPNVYADQIEWFIRHFSAREAAVVSLHTHNDRGTGIAATELALMAGAERVEGTLFGNGERTGNCDLVTMAMNLFSQGVDPELDLSEMPSIRRAVERINKLPVHERHPYAGDLVFTAFSGSHQDAIRKGMASVDRSRWEVPYLPIDPSDVGQSYKESVRVNSQSGKGGVGFVLEEHFGVALARPMLIEFSRHVQNLTETLDREVKAQEIFDELLRVYQATSTPFELIDYELSKAASGPQCLTAQVRFGEKVNELRGEGTGPIEAFVNAFVEAFNEPLNILDYRELSLSTGKDAEALCIVCIDNPEQDTGEAADQCFGIGKSSNTISASLLAIIAAANRRWTHATGGVAACVESE
ncbi:MAG: 2-isopropylmalate synthase [Gammaproteobacteria bacterium]|nr:2-isopropylmalate synthase [Gammaproteobacteria bacterium]